MNEVYYLRGIQLREPRKTSKSSIPYDDLRVPFVLIRASNGEIVIANSVADKYWLFVNAVPDDTILACWPGMTRQDVFVVDDWTKAMQALEAAGAGR